MDFFDLINRRESVRAYLEKDVEIEKIEKIIEAARVSPSACNSQPWKFIVVNNKEIVDKLKKSIYDPLIGMNKFALTVPTFIIVVGEKRNLTSKVGEIVKKKDFTSIDIGIACEHICLAAAELGIGTCMIGWFKEKGIKELLDIPKNREIHLVISLGYHENKESRKKVRKETNKIVSYNRY